MDPPADNGGMHEEIKASAVARSFLGSTLGMMVDLGISDEQIVAEVQMMLSMIRAAMEDPRAAAGAAMLVDAVQAPNPNAPVVCGDCATDSATDEDETQH